MEDGWALVISVAKVTRCKWMWSPSDNQLNESIKLIVQILMNRARCRIIPEIGQVQFGYVEDYGTRNTISYIHPHSAHPGKWSSNIYKVCPTSSNEAQVKLIKKRFVWPNMITNTREWVTTYLEWQTKSPISTFANSDTSFTRIHVEIVGRLLMCQGYQYLLTVADRFSRWPTALPIKQTPKQF